MAINGSPFEVTQSLYDILHWLWLRSSPDYPEFFVRFFIDQICINQNDISERNLQVGRMGTIYEQSFQTLAWIGHLTKNIQEATIALENIGEELRQSNYPEVDLEIGLHHTFFHHPHHVWLALNDFFHLAYWSRLWIVQEIAVSLGHLTFFGPGFEVKEESLVLGLIFVKEYLKIVVERCKMACEEDGLDFQPQEFSIRLHRVFRLLLLDMKKTRSMTSDQLTRLMNVGRDSAQKDDKDKVYGILSLIGPSLSNSIIPEYRRNVLEVYQSFTQAVITHTKSFDLICENRFDPSSGSGFSS